MSLRPMPIGEIPTETARVAAAAFPKGTLVMRLRDEFPGLLEDADFRPLYSTSRGRPGLAPWRPALVTVLQFLERLSDRQAADAVRARIDWKYALGLDLTDPGFHFSVLAEFRARLVAGRAEHLPLDRMLERLKHRGPVKARGKQRTDSTHVLAAVHDLNLLELVAETLRAALDDLAAVAPDWLRASALAVGEDGFLLLAALDGPGAPAAAREAPMVRTLRDVWRVHYARDAGRLRWRSTAELPPVSERVQSPYDPEAHFSMKRALRWTGYKVHVTETCDDDVAHVVTDVATCPSMRPDMTSTAGIHDRLAAKGLLPAEHFVDSGYVDAGLLVDSQRDHGLSLEGPVRGVSSRQMRAGGGYSLPHFRIDWERERVTCPQGRASAYWRTLRLADGSPRIQVQFSRSDCGACAARKACASAKTARRVMQLHRREEYEALRAARARAEDPAWLERYNRRAGVEGTLPQGIRAFGMRRSRYIGSAKTGLQEACAAAAINVSRVVRWLDGVPRATTRVTRFAALAQVA
jgi:transposase